MITISNKYRDGATRIDVGEAIVTITTGKTYTVSCDFSPLGVMRSGHYTAVVTCDTPGVIVGEDLATKTEGVCTLTVYAPDSAGAAYSDDITITLSLTIQGYGWQAAAIAGEPVWLPAQEVL